MVFLRPVFKALLFVVVSSVAASPAPELAARNNVTSVVLPTGTVNGTINGTWPTSIPSGNGTGTAVPSVTVIGTNETLITTAYPTLTAVPGSGTIFPTITSIASNGTLPTVTSIPAVNGTTTVIGGGNGTFTECVSYPATPTSNGTAFTSTVNNNGTDAWPTSIVSSNKTAIPTATFVGGSNGYVVCTTFAPIPTTVSFSNGIVTSSVGNNGTSLVTSYVTSFTAIPTGSGTVVFPSNISVSALPTSVGGNGTFTTTY